ncbi:ABC transporter permease, partial [Neisseria gonorrhoeae]
DDLIPYMPFSAFGNWASDTVPENVPWDSSAGSAIVFIVWAVALWILGVFVLEKRDA